MRSIVLIAHDIRSCHNVGSLLRTAEGLGVDKVYLTGYSPYPIEKNDSRLPYIAEKLDKQIQKTALGAEKLVQWQQSEDIKVVLEQLVSDGFKIIGLEQTKDSVKLPDYQPSDKVALLLGREVEGISPQLIKSCSTLIEIPMFGKKESFNVVQAAAMALYHMKFAKT